ncbi:hypothetical protein [Sinorhizobium alkalisoli]|uniref:Uncharacterized protein n=1 Tax=Sinorhizobium alkalisoli TaxID=1752398 RepID=A0A1E3VHY8_9HYPH|nr:hypothetical protein [Sinorhizobium alkalisoli]MCG5480825.1 hypothetical protein [Sinorhizobium alkalisoli]ODR93202.1 hypothetical protein A8M32_01105 [Sinorhizobium alkalisoli]QFI70527.1 hypothetical protein EKH55_5653 [Sinorhizobium alkalisoli]
MQISIVAVIDIVTALKEGTLDGNAYVIDNTGPLASPAGLRITNVPGVHNADGSQATEAVLNWIPVGIGGLPTTLPRSYRHRFISKPWNDRKADIRPRVRQHDKVRYYDAALLSAACEVLKPDNPDAAASLPPVLTRIAGPAVEQGVLYPALYGSPDLLTDGWYWSATVDTAKVGRHDYTMEVALYRPIQGNGETVWEPQLFTLTCGIQITSAPGVNGFTGSFAPGLLPVTPCSTVVAGDAI